MHISCYQSKPGELSAVLEKNISLQNCRNIREYTENSSLNNTKSMFTLFWKINYLLQYVLFPHKFLPFPVGLSNNNIQNILTVVGYITDEKNQVLQQLDDKPAREIIINFISETHCINQGSCNSYLDNK